MKQQFSDISNRQSRNVTFESKKTGETELPQSVEALPEPKQRTEVSL